MQIFYTKNSLYHRLHYCEATLREILRFETLTPVAVIHKSLEDTEFMGYKIPKVNIKAYGLKIRFVFKLLSIQGNRDGTWFI